MSHVPKFGRESRHGYGGAQYFDISSICSSAAVVADMAVKVAVAPRNPPQDLENLVNQENCQPLPCVQSNVRYTLQLQLK